MRRKQGFPGIGAIVAGTVACGVLATPGVAFATPAPDPTPTPPSARTPVVDRPTRPVPGGSVTESPVAGDPVAGNPVAGDLVAKSPVAGGPVAGGSLSGDSVAESPVAGSPITGNPVPGSPITGGSVAEGSSSLSAHPSLGHFGVAVDRPLRGRITLANPAGRTLAFRVVNPALLPAGITLDADGLLGGTSRVSGTWTVPVEACALSGGCTTGTVTITITCECARPLPPSPTLTGAPCSAGDVVTE